MCCFAKPVLSVTDTNIFARLTDKGSQMLAYQMEFSSEKPNAMILPIPVATPAKESSVRFISLEGYDDFFKDLSNGFPNITPSRGRSLGAGLLTDAIDSKLKVNEVGDFIASFVPSVDDFSRLDKQFVIPKESWAKIPAYSDYGFAVFQLKKLRGSTHPMAFEFKTRFEDKVFFPTVHIHDGEVHKREMFDHALYMQEPEYDKKVGRYKNRHVIDKATGFVRSQKPAKEFCDIPKTKGLVQGLRLVHRLEMKGKYVNQDVIADVSGKRLKLRKYSFGSLLPLTPVAAGIAGASWLVNRRNKLRNEQE